jgi:hypothetical protein
MTPKSRQIGWEVWWGKHWVELLGGRTKTDAILDICERYKIEKTQAYAYGREVGVVLDPLLERSGGDIRALFKLYLSKFPDDPDVLALIDPQTGDFLSGHEAWKEIRLGGGSSGLQPDHPSHEHIAALVEGARTIRTLLDKERLVLLSEIASLEEKIAALDSVINTERAPGRPKNNAGHPSE